MRTLAARDVAPGESWAFKEHRTMAEVDQALANAWLQARPKTYNDDDLHGA